MAGDVRERLVRALKGAAAGDQGAVQRLHEALLALSQPPQVLGDMSRAELEAQDPAKHGGIQGVPLEEDPFLLALGGVGLVGPRAVGRAALGAAKGVGKLVSKAAPWAVGTGGGAYLLQKLMGEK
jgi:hypothetical protein